MRNGKLNCWEYQECGHGPLAEGESDRAVCPAVLARGLDGVHGGVNGGRSCWAVSDTLCEGCDDLSVEEKFVAACRKCALYYRVEIEEGLELLPIDELRDRAKRAVSEPVS